MGAHVYENQLDRSGWKFACMIWTKQTYKHAKLNKRFKKHSYEHQRLVIPFLPPLDIDVTAIYRLQVSFDSYADCGFRALLVRFEWRTFNALFLTLIFNWTPPFWYITPRVVIRAATFKNMYYFTFL